MNILETLVQLRDDLKTWVITNLNAINAKIDEKTIPIDSELSSTSTNPVQNKTITNAINNIPRFSGSYNDLTDAPNITEDESGNMVIADESGNIIFKADADGIHTTAVSLNGETAATEKYVDDAVANIPTPDVSGQINAHNTNGEAHSDIRQAIEDAKEELSESITSVSDKWEIADEAGNIIFRVDAEGAHTTSLTLDGEKAATLKDIEDAIGGIVIPEVPEVDYPDIEIKDDTTIGAAEENFVNVYKNLTVDENNKHVLHEELVTIPKKEYVDEVANNLKEELSESIVAEADEWKVVDENGNIIFSVDATGAHTTELTLNGETTATEAYVDNAITTKVDFTGYATEEYVREQDNAVKQYVADNYTTPTDVEQAVAAFIEADPVALKALQELSQALENHEDAYDALLETVGGKATYEDLENLKEELSESIVAESDEWKVVDESGNIIFSVDADGAHTTALTLNGESITDIVDEKVASLVDGAPNTLNTLNKLATALGDVDNRVNDHETRITDAEDKLNYPYGKPSEGLNYTLSDDGTYYTVSRGTCTDTDVVIPPLYNGLPVTSIRYQAFWQRSNLTSIVIPDSITSISGYAFYECTSLTSVVIPDSVTSIGIQAFRNCSNLTSVVIGSGVTSISNSVFSGCTSLTNIVIPDSVTSIGDLAFDSCTGLTNVVIPDSVTSIGNQVFSGCTSLTNVVIPDSVTTIGKHAFNKCRSITSIVIGNSITSIGKYAFA